MKLFYPEDYKLDLHHWVVFALSVVTCGILALYFKSDFALIAFSVIFAVLLALSSMIDWKHGRIPDLINLLVLIFGLLMVATTAGENWSHHLMGGLMGYFGIRIIEIAYKTITSRDGIGGGDSKMIGAVGIWVTWSSLPLVLVTASLMGIAMIIATNVARRKVRRTSHIAFGPSIALSSWTIWFFELGEQFL